LFGGEKQRLSPVRRVGVPVKPDRADKEGKLFQDGISNIWGTTATQALRVWGFRCSVWPTS